MPLSRPPGIAPRPDAALLAEAGRSLVHDRLGPSDGSTVLLLHGITGSRHYWDQAAQRLSLSYDVILPDLMGFGHSPKPKARHDVEGFALCVRAFLEKHGLTERPLLACGHSLGSLVLLSYARMWPGHLKAAFVMSLPHHANRKEAHDLFLQGSANYRRLLGENSLRRTLACWMKAGPRMASRYALAFSPRIVADSRRWTYHSLTSTIEHSLLGHRVEDSLDALARLPESQRPRLAFLHGAQDQVTPLARVKELIAMPSGPPLHVVQGTGHHPIRTHPREVVELISAFFAAGRPFGATGICAS